MEAQRTDEEYLSIKIAGHNTIYAKKNAKKETEKHPDYRGDGVAVWVNDTKPLK